MPAPGGHPASTTLVFYLLLKGIVGVSCRLKSYLRLALKDSHFVKEASVPNYSVAPRTHRFSLPSCWASTDQVAVQMHLYPTQTVQMCMQAWDFRNVAMLSRKQQA